MMATNARLVHDTIFGRWKGRILHAGTALGIFDAIPEAGKRNASEIAEEIGADPALLYRLMRALGSIGFLIEDTDSHFALTEAGMLLRADVAGSLRGLVLLQEGREHYTIWRDLPGMIREGRQNGFVREFGAPAFQYAGKSPEYSGAFSLAMSSASTMQAGLVVSAIAKRGLSGITSLCDIGGGQGHLMCSLLSDFENIEGTVFDLPEVVAGATLIHARPMGVEARCTFIGGDMFEDVPIADAYFLKLILHDWSDNECVDILRVIRGRTQEDGRVFIVERIVPASNLPHFSKLYDIHMLCWGDGRERTENEYRSLLEQAGWRIEQVLTTEGGDLAVIEARPAP